MRAFFLATGPGKKNKKTIISESYVMRVYSVLSAPLYLLHYLLKTLRFLVKTRIVSVGFSINGHLK